MVERDVVRMRRDTVAVEGYQGINCGSGFIRAGGSLVLGWGEGRGKKLGYVRRRPSRSHAVWELGIFNHEYIRGGAKT